MSRKTVHIPHLSRTLVLSFALFVALGVSVTAIIGQARSAEPTPILPNLVADPPDNVSLETSTTDGGLSKPGESRLLLRFNGYIHNVGPGAVDFRGSRAAPDVSKQVEEEVEHAREKEEELPQRIEEELTMPPMKASQRLFTTNAEETNIERPHKEEASTAELIYASADGHHHWHLQHVARYSLWNAAKTAEVTPAQKVGFCLDDSQHVETKIGPSTAVYADNIAPYRDFCQKYRPNATSLFEGISPGWRDVYDSSLGFQWVEASNVLPGEYWLREDVNPNGVVKETGGANTPTYATSPTIIPGFDALAQADHVGNEEAKTVTLTSHPWKDSATPKYSIVSGPQHGKLGAVSKNIVTYTPDAGYSGPDSFTFSAADPNSKFPRSPAVATVSLEVASKPPTLSIEGAPSSMIAGTSIQLNALVRNDTSGVTWQASAGSITTGGLYTAPSEPPAGGSVTVTASLADNASVGEHRVIAILPVPPAEPAPAVLPEGGSPSPPAPPSSLAPPNPKAGTLGITSSVPPAVSRPQVMLVNRTLVMTTSVARAGRVRLSAFLGTHRLGSCVVDIPADRSFTCRVKLGTRVSLLASISVWASLRVGSEILRSLRPAGPVPRMKMPGPSELLGTAHKSIASQFVCSPSMVSGPQGTFTSAQAARLVPALLDG